MNVLVGYKSCPMSLAGKIETPSLCSLHTHTITRTHTHTHTHRQTHTQVHTQEHVKNEAGVIRYLLSFHGEESEKCNNL